mmetsp:Transcript_28327/g.53960  ORF Transcript_28327/g.53960 Transcript_28327/m.53960 type:complete len:202 (+) Transcript_28327:1135-1740(+)
MQFLDTMPVCVLSTEWQSFVEAEFNQKYSEKAFLKWRRIIFLRRTSSHDFSSGTRSLAAIKSISLNAISGSSLLTAIANKGLKLVMVGHMPNLDFMLLSIPYTCFHCGGLFSAYPLSIVENMISSGSTVPFDTISLYTFCASSDSPHLKHTPSSADTAFKSGSIPLRCISSIAKRASRGLLVFPSFTMRFVTSARTLAGST